MPLELKSMALTSSEGRNDFATWSLSTAKTTSRNSSWIVLPHWQFWHLAILHRNFFIPQYCWAK